MSAPAELWYTTKEGETFKLKSATNYSHAKLVDMCATEINNERVETSDFIEWVLRKGYYVKEQ